MSSPSQQRSLSFGAEAAAYERGRPTYPPEAIDWLLPPGARDVLDLGAGTGKLTTRLVQRGLDVVAVDPIAEMLELLSNSLPDTPALLGTAEEIPLPDNSVDAVLVAQAWHWFDTERHQVEWTSYLTPQALIDLVASRSYCITSPEQVRTRTLGQVRELLATHPALANSNGLALPYVTVCIRATLA